MNDSIEKLKDLSVIVLNFWFWLIFGISLIFIPLSLDMGMKILSISILLTTVSIIIIEKILWKNILMFLSKYEWLWALTEKYDCPILKKEYDCLIEYEWPKGVRGTKKSTIKISQTYSKISVYLSTNEIESKTITSEIVKENEEFVLYYNYRTHPMAKYIDGNKPQYGGCRLVLNSVQDIDSNKRIRGIYWTTSQTKGDMTLTSQ